MKFKRLRKAAGLLLAGAMLFTQVPASSLPQVVMAAEGIAGTPNRWESMDPDDVTLRDYATPSVSFVGWGMGADNFADNNMGSFWNAHSDDSLNSGGQWMMYDFGERKAPLTGMSIAFHDDGGGVVTPTGIITEYKDDAGNWVEVTRKGTWTFTPESSVTYEFEPVTTSAIRVTMVHAELNGEKMPVAVYDWKLLGEIPADFPKPETVEPEPESPDLQLPDVAVYATASAEHTASWNRVDAINDETVNPTKSDGDNNCWGNWGEGHAVGTECWLQYDWPAEITTKTFQVYWFGSEAGMKIASKVRFQYKDADGAWKDAVLVSNRKNFAKYDKYNQITIEPVTTKSIRMYMTISGSAVGVYRWKVHSDVNDDFVVASAADSLTIPEVREGRTSSRLNQKLTLPSKAVGDRVNVSWKSKSPDVVSDAGVITPPAANTKVTLEAACTLASDPSIKAVKDIEFLVLSKDTTEYAMTIDRNNRGVDISQQLYGVFYEDINSSADGGLSTELVKNNSFQNYQAQDSATSPEVKGDQASWKLHWSSNNAAGFAVERTDGLNETNTNYAKITGNMELSNRGFVGKWSLDKSAIAITKDKKYDFSMYMKADNAYAGNVKVKVVDDAGAAITDEASLTLQKDGKWNKISASLTGTETKLGTLVLTFAGAGASDAMYIDMVSLIPTDSYGYGNKNYSYGAGLRKDLVEKLQELGPDFIRFPGGCAIEGSYGVDGYYNWEDSVGPLEERKAIGSYWGTPGHAETGVPDGYGYMMSYQLGYHEILTLCEDLGAEALPILSAGIFCQFRQTASPFTGAALEPFAKHATNLIDYCWGNPISSDATQAKWASKRVANGHEEPFDLNYVGIGNENWGQTYYDNFEWIKDYVDKYVEAHYPGRKITIISSTGPYYQGGQNTDAWRWINSKLAGQTLVDEHYYINYAGDGNNTLLNGDYAYDSYKRLKDGGSNVFIGEYAGHNTGTKENVLDTAISEAAYMTGIERNADIVRHASYAPLFEREGCRDWNYNLIKFDAFESYGTPSYYVQTMYSNNYGDHIINTTLEKYDSKNGVTTAYDKKPGHQTELYYVTSEDDNYIYTKLVNHADYAKEITLNYPGIADGTKVELISLSGNAMDMNTIEDQTKVAPVTKSQTLNGGSMTYVVPAMSLTVVKVQTGQEQAVSKTALDASIAAAEGKRQADYTADSWSKMQTALRAAKTVSADSNATQTEVNNAKTALDAAVNSLVKKTAGPTVANKKKTLVVGETFSVAAKGYTYTTSDKKTASVSKKGIVKALKGGKTVTIKATSSDKKKVVQYKVTIKKAPSKIAKVAYKVKGEKKAKNIKLKSNKGSITLKKGKSAAFTPSVKKGTATKYKYAFTSSKAKKYAAVSSKGVLKAKKKGTVKVKIQTLNNKSVTITVKIK